MAKSMHPNGFLGNKLIYSSEIKYNDPVECDEEFRFNYRNKSEFTINYDSKK
jgi:hypothetical protein